MLRTNNKAVRLFSIIRLYVIGVVLLAYIIYSSFPRLNFLLVLILTALFAGLVGFVISRIKRARLVKKAEQPPAF